MRKPVPAPSPTSRLIEAALVSSVQPLLKPLGYKKRGRSFVAQRGELYHVINFQSNKWNTPETATFTMNLHVTFPCFHELRLGLPFPTNPASTVNVIQQRIGELLPEAKDYWWRVTPASDVGELGSELREALLGYGLPFLQPFESLPALTAALEGEDWREGFAGDTRILRALCLACLGEIEQAAQLIQHLKAVSTRETTIAWLGTLESRMRSRAAKA